MHGGAAGSGAPRGERNGSYRHAITQSSGSETGAAGLAAGIASMGRVYLLGQLGNNLRYSATNAVRFRYN